ncbi:MAG: hypothetical protein WCF30_09610 [Terracidiphilus sp.]
MANNVETIGTFKSEQSILDGRPAATFRKLGKGVVVKLAFWPKDDSFLVLLERLLGVQNELLAKALPDGLLAVPRADGSTFVINATGKQHELHLKTMCTDRLSSGVVKTLQVLSPYEVLWLERHQ